MRFLVFGFWLLVFGWLVSMPSHAQQKGKPFFQNIAATEYHGHNRNFDIECDKAGNVYVANFEGLLIYDGIEWKMIHTPGISRITALYTDGNNRVWFGGHNVFGYVDEEQNAVFVANDNEKSISFSEVVRIYSDKDDANISFLTSEGKVYEVVPKGEKSGQYIIAARNGKSPYDVDTHHVYEGMTVNNQVSIPDFGYTALATEKNGVVILNGNKEIEYTLAQEDGLCSSTVNDLAYNGKGNLWGVTDNGIFVITLSPVYSHYSEADGLSGQVTSILRQDDRLYVGTLQGLFILSLQDKFVKVPEVSLACWQLADLSGITLAATAEGVYACSSGIRHISNNHTLSILNIDNDSFYTGEINGIYLRTLSGGEKRIADIDNVAKFVRDADGGIWAITLYKETYYKAPGASTFVKKKNSKLTLLFEYRDSNGHLWSCEKNGMGLCCDDNGIRKAWFAPFSNHNIQTMYSDGGVAWIGGNFGIIRLDVDRARSAAPYSPKLYVRRFEQNAADVDFYISNDKIDPIGETVYSYRLTHDGKWSAWSDDKDINLHNLAHGDYQLTVRSKDAFGNVAESAAYEFDIPTPIYLRWWAIMLYLLLTAIIVYLLFQYRLYRANQDKIRLEAIVDERTSELKKAQKQLLRQEREATIGKLTKGLIDRILNPINYINNFSHLTTGLVKDLKENIEDEKEKMTDDNYEDSVDVLNMMTTNLEKIEQHGISTTRILKAMEELLRERSSKMDAMNIANLCAQNIEVFKKYFEKDISQYGITVNWTKPEMPIVADVVSEQFNKVIAAMLGNAMYAVKKKKEKFANRADDYKAEISLFILPDDGIDPPKIVVYDNGIGIEDSIADKIFDPFFTTKPTAEAPGIGLYLAQQIIQDMAGSISVESVKDEYTKFTISLP